MTMTTRQPVALSLAGFQFTYRNSYFDWRLLHGIDVDNVIRLTDVQAVEDCLDTLQRGSFAVDRDRLSPANCVQLFRLLQLAIEYCAHLRAAHALLLDCYNTATEAAENWKSATRAFIDTGSAFLSESLGSGSLNRGLLDSTDAAKEALEEADAGYNGALDALETEDSRARHFRFRKQRTEISWSQLHAADADRLVACLDVALLEGLLPNLTFGSITNEDHEQLTPHHFGQLIPLAQAALDYVLWQANATGALMEQAMAALRIACADIPALTSATQELHNQITSLLVGGLQSPQTGGLLPGATPPASAGPGYPAGLVNPPAGFSMGGFGELSRGGGERLGALGGVSSPVWGSVDLPQYGSGRMNGISGFSPRAREPFPQGRRQHASGGPGGIPQVLRLGPSRMSITANAKGSVPALEGSYSGRLAAVLGLGAGGSPAAGHMPLSYASGALEELVAATLASGGGAAEAAAVGTLPVLELHSRAAELSSKVDAIELDLRIERSKTEEMKRILMDIRDRLNQRPGGRGGGGALSSPGTATPLMGVASVLSPAESLTFPAGASNVSVDAGMGSMGFNGYSVFSYSPAAAVAAIGGGGGALPHGMSLSASPNNAEGPQAYPKARVFVDEDAIRGQERQRALQLLTKQAEKLKQQMLRDHQERRQATSVSSSIARASLQVHQQQKEPSVHSRREGSVHNRDLTNREGGGPRRSSPAKASRRGSSTNFGRVSPTDYSSDPDAPQQGFHTGAAAGGGGSAGDPRVASRPTTGAGVSGGSSRPPRPLSRLSSHLMNFGELPSADLGYQQQLPEPLVPLTVEPPSSAPSRRVSTSGGVPNRTAPRAPSARLPASSAFGSIALVGAENEAAAAATGAAGIAMAAAATAQRSR